MQCSDYSDSLAASFLFLLARAPTRLVAILTCVVGPPHILELVAVLTSVVGLFKIIYFGVRIVYSSTECPTSLQGRRSLILVFSKNRSQWGPVNIDCWRGGGFGMLFLVGGSDGWRSVDVFELFYGQLVGTCLSNWCVIATSLSNCALNSRQPF